MHWSLIWEKESILFWYHYFLLPINLERVLTMAIGISRTVEIGAIVAVGLAVATALIQYGKLSTLIEGNADRIEKIEKKSRKTRSWNP